MRKKVGPWLRNLKAGFKLFKHAALDKLRFTEKKSTTLADHKWGREFFMNFPFPKLLGN
jgi:hypothetical protein